MGRDVGSGREWREWEGGTAKEKTSWVNVNNAKHAARGHISTLSM